MRADQYLVTHGHYESRARAQSAIKAGKVTVDGAVVRKASQTIPIAAVVNAEPEHPWVSRGGIKLAYALDTFNFDPTGLNCLDVGSSTGGFTQVLLANGAAHVCAVDVGREQFHNELRGHPKITLLESQDARGLTSELIGFSPDLIVCDASFIALSKVLAVPLSLAAKGASLISLVKPQFEVGRDGIGRGGLVKDNSLALASVAQVKAWLDSIGWAIEGEGLSPIKGGSGNVEYLLKASLR
ncbi:23S rRNA (cytidine1920-2'-O)/16S rRNA (cytidine1409-2'-O)-methyltransferase [Litorimonas taeanensis]|uniref:23S rRNA (Cytidine1920-2'-O)/16S rRNA (Cytidine1409-2'-O)-methyltransferase n=1 Tax=Litorimonas taeanensis TaxID=568099 RepID=A0A420WII7_9PROT|nr:TlyA family RNA methyltransferase [Litorimonas taeanensis]RKQ70851.1 23S rRNA (cytidine1920-2'-O)/16S rRNA (cytidine1409-2'-O)-methyltransferase [Litorimonas taeanensis]